MAKLVKTNTFGKAMKTDSPAAAQTQAGVFATFERWRAAMLEKGWP